MSRISSAMTLIELIIALVLLSVIVLGLNSITLFSHFHVTSSDRRAKIQNEVSLALEHMSKEISRAIGSEIIDGVDSVVRIQNISGDYAIWSYIDDGSPADGRRDTTNDHWIVYRFTGAGASATNRYQIWYCPLCTNGPCTQCNPAWGTDRIARNINALTLTKPTNGSGQLNANSVTAQLTACWDPQTAVLPNGSIDNPCVNMNTNIKMPSVSTN